jgi:hypothetical protein
MKREEGIGHTCLPAGRGQRAGAKRLLFAVLFFAPLRLCATINNKIQTCLSGRQATNIKTPQLTLGGSKYKTFPCLPQGGFNSGVCPGAAAITILYFHTGSPRDSLGASQTPAVMNSRSPVRSPADREEKHKEMEDLPMI